MALCVGVSTNITTTGATFYVCVQVHNLYNFSFSCYMKFSHKSSFLKNLIPSVAMEKQIEELKQQLEKQCLINKELQRQNKDLGEYNNNYISFKYCRDFIVQ